MAELVRLLGRVAGGRPAERLMTRLGMPMSDDTILRHLKRRSVAPTSAQLSLRVVGMDDWSWLKGSRYGTLIVDLERRQVVDVLPDRSASSTAQRLSKHPEVEIVSPDRCGPYALGVKQEAPQARQVADRFHLLQNLRDRIEEQLSRRHTAEVPALEEADAKPDADRQSVAKGPREDQDLAAHRQLVKQTRRDVRQIPGSTASSRCAKPAAR